MAPVPAASHTLRVLDHLARQAGPVGAAAMARDLDLPRSTVYHLLATLAQHNFVTHLPDERRWALGIAAYELGTGYARQAPLTRVSRVPLAELADRTGHAAHLAVLHGSEVVYLLEERAPGRPPLVTDVRVRLPAALTASGRAMLALLPAAQIRALFPGPEAFVVRTGRGPRSAAALRALLADTRRQGWGRESGEVSEGYASLASAVVDHSGHPVAAVALTFPIDPIGNADSAAGADTARATALVGRAADTISRRIGGTPARV